MKNIEELRVSFKKNGFALIQFDDGPVHSYPYDAPWITDLVFRTLYEKIRHNTLVDRTRAYSLYLIAEQVKDVPGDVLEVGVWRGGTAGVLASVLNEKTIYLADTFRGIVKSSEWEHYVDKTHDDTCVDLVTKFLSNDIGVQNYIILEGIFPEETVEEIKDKDLCLVYLDVDVYRSTKDAFNAIWSQVTKGGIVIFDDYGMISACEGVSKFVDEIRHDADKLFISNLNGQAYVIKR